MKKMILIAASFLLNNTCVKHDCFAMENTFALYKGPNERSKEKQRKTEKALNNTNTINALIKETVQNFKKNPKNISNYAPEGMKEFFAEEQLEKGLLDLMDKLGERSFESLRDMVRTYVALSSCCVVLSNRYAVYKKATEDAEAKNSRLENEIKTNNETNADFMDLYKSLCKSKEIIHDNECKLLEEKNEVLRQEIAQLEKIKNNEEEIIHDNVCKYKLLEEKNEALRQEITQLEKIKNNIETARDGYEFQNQNLKQRINFINDELKKEKEENKRLKKRLKEIE